MVMQAYSIGGGRIRVSVLDGIEVDFSGESNTLIVRNMDRPGCITEVSAALSYEKINVATMQVFRHKEWKCSHGRRDRSVHSGKCSE